MARYVISLDCGTQSVRALLFDTQGNLLAKTKSEFEPYFSLKPGYAEQHPDLYFEGLCDCLKALSVMEPERILDVEAVCLTTLRDTGVFLDEAYEVVRPSMLWLDQRTARCEQPLPAKDRAMFKAVGMTRAINVTRRLAKVNWMRENEPENWHNTRYYVLLPAFLQHRFTGLLVDSIGNQIGHVPFHYKTQNWPRSKHDYRWPLFGIEREKLYPLNHPGDIVGPIKDEVAMRTGLKKGTLMISGGSDKGCETLGVGCVDLTTASLSFGTTATIQTTSPHYFEPIPFMPPYPACIPKRYNPEVQVFRGYWMIRWFKNEFASREMEEAKRQGIPLEEMLNQSLKSVPPGSNGLILQPYWTPGLKEPDAKGCILGFNDTHTRAHVYRAIIEGINYGLMDGLSKIEKKSKTKVKRLFVSGGGSQSDEICQITADMFNLDVYKGETYEAAGLGAAIIACVGLGVYPSFEDAVSHMVRYSKGFKPDPRTAETYSAIYRKVYVHIYSSLSSLYATMNHILNKQEAPYEQGEE